MFLWGGGNPAPSRCAPWGYTEIMHLKIKTLKPSKHRQTAGYNRSFALLLNGCDRKLDASVHFCWKTMRHALPLQSSLGGVILPVSLSKSFPRCLASPRAGGAAARSTPVSHRASLSHLLGILSTGCPLPLMVPEKCISSAELIAFPYIVIFTVT